MVYEDYDRFNDSTCISALPICCPRSSTSSYMFFKLQMSILRHLCPELGEKKIHLTSGKTHLKLELENCEE